jgi:multidrug efflux pump subunit AcrA (membrane-fusion protein)
MNAAPVQTPRIIPRPQPPAKTAHADATSARPALAAAHPMVKPRPALVQPPVDIKLAGQPAPAAQAAREPDPISQFIDLEVEARRCPDLNALRYAIVNSTRKVAHFDQAFLAEPAVGGGWTITRASSVASIDRNSQAVKLLETWIQKSLQEAAGGLGEPRLANLSGDAQPTAQPDPAVPFPFALWLPIKARDGRILSALVALKRENWRPQHSALLLPLADAYGHAWNALAPLSAAPAARLRKYVSKSRLAIAAAVIALIAAFIPVPLSALAPAEISAADPMLVTAPIDGVIGEIAVPPGTWVEKGTPILKFVDVKLRNEVEVAKRNKAVSESRHFKIMQSAIATQKDMQEIGTAKAELDVAIAELRYAEDMLARSIVRAERSGLLIYAAKSDWIGKPVTIGERLMEIGDPASTEIKIDVPVSDAVAIQRDGAVALFLDGDPLNAVEGKVTRISYRPTLTHEQQLAFRVYAKFTDGQARRIGLRGVARVNSANVSLWFYLFRRPIAALRQRFGI